MTTIKMSRRSQRLEKKIVFPAYVLSSISEKLGSNATLFWLFSLSLMDDGDVLSFKEIEKLYRKCSQDKITIDILLQLKDVGMVSETDECFIIYDEPFSEEVKERMKKCWEIELKEYYAQH